LVGIVLVAAIRFASKKRPLLTFPNLLYVFLTCISAPSVPVFLIYPFVEPKPDLRNHAVFLLAAAFGIVWVIYRTSRQATE
jgi:hypothetical protein